MPQRVLWILKRTETGLEVPCVLCTLNANSVQSDPRHAQNWTGFIFIMEEVVMFWFPGIYLLCFLFPCLWTAEEQVYSEARGLNLWKMLFFWESWLEKFAFVSLSDGVQVNETWESGSKFKEEREITVPSEQDNGSAFKRNGCDAWAVSTQRFDPVYLSQKFQNTQ